MQQIYLSPQKTIFFIAILKTKGESKKFSKDSGLGFECKSQERW
jgi:hypothetical protein